MVKLSAVVLCTLCNCSPGARIVTSELAGDAILARNDKEFDLILYGATGCVGGIAAEYLAKQPGLKWAVAGRTETKLRALVDKIALGEPASTPEVLVAPLDETTVKSWVQRTTAVASAAGPFYKNGGEILVKACAELGVHYADTSDEFFWQRWMIDRYHEIAKASGSAAVLGSGFTVLATDLGSQIAMSTLSADLAAPPSAEDITMVNAVLQKYNGGWSSGVLALLTGKDNATYPKEWATDPYVLAPEAPETVKLDTTVTGVRKISRLPGMGTVTGDLFGEYNARLLRRSFAQLGQRVNLRDGAYVSTYTKWTGFLLRHIGRVKLKMSCPPEKIRKTGSWAMSFRAARADKFAQVKLSGNGDPGYVLTPLGLAEVGLCLAGKTTGCRNDNTAGVLTPASALHIPVLQERLQSVGLLQPTQVVKRSPLAASVKAIDIKSFMGCWFVHANVPTVFDRDSVNNVEIYEWVEDKKRIQVSFIYDKKGKTKQLLQHAKVVNDEGTHWTLSPKFGIYLPLKLPYIVLDCADDYSYTIIGYPDRSYVWIMTRSTSIDESALEALIDKAVDFGYPRDKIVKVPFAANATLPELCTKADS